MVHPHAPQQQGFFGRCISESDVCVFTENQNMPRNAKDSEVRLEARAVVRKIRWDFLVHCVALSQNVRKNGQVGAQIGQDVPVQTLTIQITNAAGCGRIQQADQVSILIWFLVDQTVEKPCKLQDWGWDLLCHRSHL